jgi:ATP-dependent Lon protease
LACALVSLISGVAVRHDVAMTCELTLRGKVLPIGGLKEKLLAAARAGVTTVLIPAGNAPELSEIPPHVMSKLTVKAVRTMDEVLEIALANGDTKTTVEVDEKPARGRERRKATPRPGTA